MHSPPFLPVFPTLNIYIPFIYKPVLSSTQLSQLTGRMSSCLNILPFLALFVIFSLAIAVPPKKISTSNHQRRPACDDMCKFRWCLPFPGSMPGRPGRRILLRDHSVATFPIVCLPGTPELGDIIKTGEARVRPASSTGPFTPISLYGRGVRPPFSRNYFQLRELSSFPPIPGKYGLVRGKSKGNQEDFVDDLCVVIPITKYRVAGRVVDTRNPKSCISATTVRPTILAEMTWDTGDDLDLRIIEPDGNEIYHGNQVSPTGGKLNQDTNVGGCGERTFGREQIRWLADSTPLDGEYTVQVRHYSRCSSPAPKPNWSLSIIVNGKLLQTESGQSDLDGDAVIYETKFRYSG